MILIRCVRLHDCDVRQIVPSIVVVGVVVA